MKKSELTFFMPMIPPTVTAQERSVRVVSGKPVFFEPAQLQEARSMLMGHLASRTPPVPFGRAVELKVLWGFPQGRHLNGEWRTTKPDTDNLQKLLKDCMTRVGFWKDDALVVREVVEKRWSNPSGIYIEIREV